MKNASISLRTKYNRLLLLIVVSKFPVGTFADDLTNNRSFGCKWDSSSIDVGVFPIGLSLIRYADSKRTVCNSLNVTDWSPIEMNIDFFTDHIIASQQPMYHGALLGEKVHSKPFLLL